MKNDEHEATIDAMIAPFQNGVMAMSSQGMAELRALAATRLGSLTAQAARNTNATTTPNPISRTTTPAKPVVASPAKSKSVLRREAAQREPTKTTTTTTTKKTITAPVAVPARKDRTMMMTRTPFKSERASRAYLERVADDPTANSDARREAGSALAKLGLRLPPDEHAKVLSGMGIRERERGGPIVREDGSVEFRRVLPSEARRAAGGAA
ncbi:MAG: hypothetical protein KIT84_26480 [Labilithrix sp.]|nr:hypothetical protein [Labilithrix sp.]MCW5814600.1 hypothetical protein [Labilithrix sp.]